MRKLIAAINLTVDGFCDHTSGVADDEMLQHYTDLLRGADAILYGRVTYQLMEGYWPALIKTPTGNSILDEFAQAIQNIQKIVFSRTLKELPWENSRLANQDLKTEILDLKKQAGKDFLVGSPGLISALTEMNLVDEYQLCVHPVIAGHGLRLFQNIHKTIILKQLKTKIFNSSGATLHYYTRKT